MKKNIALLMAVLMLLFAVVACSEQKTPSETIESSGYTETLCEHQYDWELLCDVTCTQTGILQYTCTQCGASYTEDIPAFGHEVSSVSCKEAASCDICGQTVEDAPGHQIENGVCIRCGESIDTFQETQ